MRPLILFTLLLLSAPTAYAESGLCTAEARICPDGTAVGRGGPNCEFAPCPSLMEDPGTGSGNSGLTGTAAFGNGEPFQGTLVIRQAAVDGTPREASRVQTGPSGSFEAPLPPGTYSIVTEGDTSTPRCSAEVTVRPGRYTAIVVGCEAAVRGN